MMRRALWNALKKLHPALLIRNPVIFITELGAILTSVELYWASPHTAHFTAQIAIWLWITVFAANFAESMAEIRNRSQADSLRASRVELTAYLLTPLGKKRTKASLLKKDNLVVVSAGEFIPGDGEIVEGIASIDESSVTGESNPIIRAAGSDHTGVIAGTKVLSDQITVRIGADAGNSFLDRMILLIEGAQHKRTKNEITLTILLSSLCFMFLVVVATFKLFGLYFFISVPWTMLVSLLICIIPTTIGGLLNAIGIAGINRLMQKRVLAMSGQAIESAGDIDVILIDKTGTITEGTRRAIDLICARGISEQELAGASYLASIRDETAEGKSIVTWIEEHQNFAKMQDLSGIEVIPFSAATRMSGVNIGQRTIRKGAIDTIEAFCGTPMPYEVAQIADEISRLGGTPLLVAENCQILGIIYLKDVVKKGLSEQFQRFRKMGLRTVMLTGDNPITAAAIAKEAGVDEFRAQVSPKDKLSYLFEQQDAGYSVAMTGDGVNDAPALAFANVGLAMNAGTQAAKEAGNMIDLDSDPTKLFEIIEIGKQMLMTRGALASLSFANDLAKYFAIIPALLAPFFPASRALNIMNLSSPESAVLSAVIFNALIMITLVPLALKGIKFIPQGASQIFHRNLLIYGVGGLILPFVGIKIIDLVIHNVGLL